MQIQWHCKTFNTLTLLQLYAIMQLRNEVFVVEQKCVFQDADDKDLEAYHLMGTCNNNIVAYARLLNKGVAYTNEISIGRVVTKKAFRGNAIGKQLMQQAILHSQQIFTGVAIKIGAQLYLKKFYESFGFVQCSNVYEEDGIEHIKMIKSE